MAEIPTNEWHRVLLSSVPTERQQIIYKRYPTIRGFSSSARDPELLEAVVVLALRSGSIANRPLILAPIAMEQWVLDGIESLAIQVFKRCKASPGLVNGYGQLFKKLTLTGRILQLPQEPDHWVSIGFTTQDVLPDWMPIKLLNVL